MMSSGENNPTLMNPTNVQGVRKFGQEVRHNRRALGVINQNLVVSKSLPCVVNKTKLSEDCHFGKKNVSNAAPRPNLTRKSAAEVDSKQTHPNECKKLKPTIPSRNEFGDSIFVDDSECRSLSENFAPLNLEHSESGEKHIEANQMDEVEMEDIDDDESDFDIDSCDSKNPLAVVDYVDELYVYYKRMEIQSCVSTNYMGQQFDINEKMRAILIDWLIEVHYKFELLSETLFLTINLIDRFLAKQTVIRKKLQLVGLVAMLLACKYEEVSVPIVEDLIIISDRAYTRQEFLEMEKLMLNTLQFNMSLPTPYVFIKRFLKAARSDKKLELLAFFLIDLSLVEYAMLKFPPSLLAAAAVYTAHCTLYGFKEWSKTCEWHSSYSEAELLECSKLMVGFHQRAATGKLTGVHRKYSTSKYNYTAKQEPALFLINNQ